MGIELRDLVIVVPGIMGSNLARHGNAVWSTSLWRLAHIAISLGGSLEPIALGDDPPELDDLGDGVEATGLIDIPTILPRFVKADGYRGLIDRLAYYFDVVKDGKVTNLCSFPYDWRRDNRVAARRLDAFITEQLAAWREVAGPEAKVIIIGHSMGGLIARYALEVHGRWRDCRALFTLGTPFRGSPQALDYLSNGYTALGGAIDVAKVVRTFTAAYQLLPTYPVLSTATGAIRVADMPGIPNLDYKRVQAAQAFHTELRDAVTRNMKDSIYRQDGYKLVPVVGRDQPTCQSATLVDGRLVSNETLPIGLPATLGGGDGTVPRLSASPADLDGQAREAFIVERHASLHVNDHVLVDIISRIEQLQAPDTQAFLGGRMMGDRPALSLSLEDRYLTGGEVMLTVNLAHGHLTEAPQVRVINAEDPKQKTVSSGIPIDASSWVVRLAGLHEGVYRLEVKDPSGNALSVHDVFEVSDLRMVV